MNAKRILIGTIALSAGLFFQTVNADTLGFRAGTGIWQPESSGTFSHGGGNIDLKSDLYLKDEDQQYTYAILEHPIPLIPNLKISQTVLSSKGTGDVTGAGFDFASTPYTAGTTVTTEMVLDHSDATIYWQLLDNWINIDFGLTARKFDGKLAVTAAGITKQTNIDKTVPMLYLAAGIEPPFIEDLFIGMEANIIELDGNNISDITAKVSYTTGYFIGFEVGVRTFIVELDNVGGNSSNMEFTGSFANLYIHF